MGLHQTHRIRPSGLPVEVVGFFPLSIAEEIYPRFVFNRIPDRRELIANPVFFEGASRRAVKTSARLFLKWGVSCILGFFALCVALFRAHPFAPLYLVTTSWLQHRLGGVDGMDWIQHSVDSVMSEALMVPWLFLTAALVVMALLHKDRRAYI